MFLIIILYSRLFRVLKFVKWRLKKMNKVVHSTLYLHFWLFANPVPLLTIIQMCCQKLLYALTLVGWVYSTPEGSQWRSY